MGSYIDKKIGKDENDVGSLKNLVNKEFKNIDKIGYRDDQEILKAGRNVCKNLINEIKNDKTMTYGTRALSPLNNLINDLIKEHNNMKGLKAFTNNKDKINQVANRIDNAENETLRRLQRNNATQKSRNIIEKSKKTNNGNQMFVMEGGSDVKKQTGCLIFTKASNPVRIDQALKGLFDNPDIVYQIDYSKCDTSTKKGRDIKNKMMRLTGTKTCYLRYDKTQKTYTIRDSQGNGICDRAYIWEGVRLIPDGIRKWESYNAEKKANEKLGEDAVYNSDKLAKLTRAMQKDMPSIKNRTPKEQVTLCQKTEIRLNELLKKAKSLGYEIDPECITKKWIGRGHMELHLTSGSSETSRTVIENSDQIGGKDLYSFIGSHVGEYKTYLTRRVKEKRQEFERLTKTEKTNVGKKGKEKLTEKQQIEENNRKNQILYGIGLFDKMIENFRESEGDSWLDNDDKALVEIKNLIRNAKASINDTEIIDNAALKKSFIDPIWFKRASFKRITKTIQDSEGRVTNNPQYQQQYNQLRKIFFGKRNEQIDGIRNLGGHNRIFDKTETSFLQQEIEGNEDLNVKDANIQNCINNIQRRLQNQNIFNEDGSINQKTKEQLDKMFTYARQGTESLIGLLVRSKMLPENRKKEEKKVRKCVENLKNQLNEVNKQSNSINTSLGSMREEQHKEKLRLEQKENKTENDIKRLQALTYLEENPQEQNKINKKTIDQMKIEIKYGNVGQITKGCLFTALAELGGGATGKNADIYNDIIGYGKWNASDENAKLAGEIITEIAITVAVAIVTCGVGAVAVGTVLRGAALVARGGRRTKLANYVYKAINVSQKGYKTLKRGGKAAKLGIRSSELLIEGTTFNAASTMVHSAVNGTSLDNLNLNPVAKENIQTAAFLGALSIGNKLGMKVISKLHGQTKIQAFSQAGLKEILKTHKGVFTESLISEATAMFGAEQGMNFMFGHDVINPETGEIETSRSLQRPTQQELIQMIGMIIAFKVVKPGLWAKYEKSLNDGTLEICRSIKENEVLIRNTKTGKIEKIQDLIDGRYNKYKPTPEQYKLRNHNKRLEKQSKYNAEYSEAIEIISKIPEELRTENMKKLLKYKDMIEASPNDIKRIQKEIGLKGKDVDGVIGPNFVSKLIDYTKKIKSRSTGGKENTGEHSKGENQELINKKQSREKRKEELEKQKKDLETKRQELLKQREANWRSLDLKENGIEKITDILKKGNIITIDGLKYKFNGIKNGKAEFVIEPAAKKSAELGSKRYSEKIEISSLEELLDPRFNLEPGQKRTNSGRYKKLEQLIKDKIEPLDRLKKKIRKKQGEITTLQEEIARLEKGKDTTAHNNYFKENKNKLIGKNVRIDGVKYRAEQLNKDGSIQFKQVDGKDHFVVKSFKELAEKGQVSGFSDGLLADGSTRRGSEELTKSERDNHELIENLIKEEQKYLNSRNIQETINQKKSELQRAQEELKLLQEKLPESQTRQEKIDERAKKGEEINKELRKIEEEIERNNRELSEADRLTKKYKEELDGKAVTENEKKEEIKEEIKEEKETLSTEIKNEIKDKIPDLLKNEHISSINSEFSNNPELHKNFIETKIIKKLLNYVENITKSGRNPDLIEVLKLSKEELNNIQYEQRIEIINKIDTYLKSVETATKFINIQKSGGVTAKELFLRAKGLDTSKIKNFEGNVTIEQFRNSIVFIFEKASDVQRFFGQKGNGSHFENKIPGLDTIIINKENCKNAEKIGLKEEDAISRVIQHESQHTINEIFMPKDIRITHEEAMNPTITDINTVKEYALNRVKNEIVAQYTNRLIKHRLSTRTIEELSKGIGIKKFLTNPKNGGVYDYFGNRKNTPEGKKAREEYKKEVEQMCDYIDETLKSCKSNEEIQDMLNMFCLSNTKERKNIKDIIKGKEEQERKQREEQERKQREEQERKQREEQERKQREEQERNGNERPEWGINTERREMSEVKRNTDVIAIGDLHGEYIALKGNMEFAGLAKEINGHLEWTGGNKKVVFQGDILADRGTDGLRIIKEIHQLREQAKKQGGDIDIIVGNHDDFMIAYLLGGKVSRFARPGEEVSGLEIAMFHSQGQGLTELLDFVGINRTGEFDDFLNLGGKDKNKRILEAMRKSTEGRLILEEICNMKLVTQVDDVLYIHTNPTARILQYLTRGNIQSNINSLNQKYQGFLRKAFLGEGDGTISLDEFNNISDIFLNTGNRDISGIENYVEQLKNSGINMISHGHSGGSQYRSTEIGGVKIVDTDYTYGKYGELDHEHSISIVKKENGNVQSGEGYNKYIGKTIDFHLGDRKQYRGTIEGIQGVGKNQRVIIKYIDPQYGEQRINSKLSDINNWGGFKIET